MRGEAVLVEIKPMADELILSERLVRYTREILQWMLRRMSRHDVIICLKHALRLMEVTTDK